MIYQAWAVATNPGNLRVEAMTFIAESKQRLDVENFIERNGGTGPEVRELQRMFPRHLVTMRMLFVDSLTGAFPVPRPGLIENATQSPQQASL